MTYICIVEGILENMKTHANIYTHTHTPNANIVCTDATLIVTNGL